MLDLPQDRSLLVAALQEIARKRAARSGATLLSPSTEDEISIIADVIGRCTAFKIVAGHQVFSANGSVPLDERKLATDLLSRLKFSDNADHAADWLLRVLTTKDTKGAFIAAIWGLELANTVTLSENSKLIPFSELPNSLGNLEE